MTGRPPATDHESIVLAALDLFLDRGYDRTTMDDIAAAAGIGRTTLWRFFASKSAVLWAQYEARLAELHEALAATPEGPSPAAEVFAAFLALDRAHPERRAADKQRTRLIVVTPSAYGAGAWSAYQEMGTCVVEHVARRAGGRPNDLAHQLVGMAVWSAVWTATEHWAMSPDEAPDAVFARALDQLERVSRWGTSASPGTGRRAT